MFAGVNVMNGTSMPKKYDCRSCGEEYPQGVKCDRCPPVEGVQEFYEKLYDRIRLDDFTRLTKITALEFALSLAEAYADFRATQERERADAAERERDSDQEAIEHAATLLLPLVDTKDGTLVSLAENAAKEVESLRTELRERTEARDKWIAEWNSANIKRATAERDMREALEHVIKHVTFSRNLCRDCAKAEALLSRKGEGS